VAAAMESAFKRLRADDSYDIPFWEKSAWAGYSWLASVVSSAQFFDTR
jgi:hypothetical protein